LKDNEVDFILHVVDILECGVGMSARDKIERIEETASELIPEFIKCMIYSKYEK
jgi:hypothetical protein